MPAANAATRRQILAFVLPTAIAGLLASPLHAAPPVHGHGTGTDPFAARSLSNDDPRAAAAGGPDPFTLAPASAVQALPPRLVIGRPGGDRVATRGWIAILASIPTDSGRQAAIRFARDARRSVGALSILNSSQRRPLRGGYWVVYTGPYSSLLDVTRRVGGVHAAGYRTAYIRELIAYR